MHRITIEIEFAAKADAEFAADSAAVWCLEAPGAGWWSVALDGKTTTDRNIERSIMEDRDWEWEGGA